MGIYVNPGNRTLSMNLRSDIYVDKSMILAVLNRHFDSEARFLCVSRPRRFGKTMLGNLISAYYSKGADSRKLFAPMKFAGEEGWDARLNQCNVIKIDLNAFLSRGTGPSGVVRSLTRSVVAEMAAEFPKAGIASGASLAEAMIAVYAATGETFVVIIDEYDAPIRERAGRADADGYLSLLNSLFKAADAAETISLAYLTGILPIVRDKVQSKLNNFSEFTMTSADEFAPFVGFTRPEVEGLCAERGMDRDECLRWYDGYRMTPGVSVCNANSVCQAMRRGRFDNYWNSTGSYEAINTHLDFNFEGLRDSVTTMLGGGRAAVNVRSFLNTLDMFNSRDDVLTYLIHLGYLAYDNADGQCYIPNDEIRDEWVLAMSRRPELSGVVQTIADSRRLLRATQAADAQAVAEALDRAHQEATSPLTYNNEGSLQSAIGLAYFYAKAEYAIFKELPAGRGYADMAFVPLRPGAPAIIVELKMGGGAGRALRQVADRRYADALSAFRGPLLLVGVSYDAKSKTHTCKIEKTEWDATPPAGRRS